MTDVHTPIQRSFNMSRVKNKNTSLEINFRKLLYKKGLRGYRINYSLPGKPDIVFINKKIAIFLDGCFWHMCPKCCKMPSSNSEFWRNKLKKNKIRDDKANTELKKLGYTVYRFWEHDLKESSDEYVSKIYKRIAIN